MSTEFAYSNTGKENSVKDSAFERLRLWVMVTRVVKEMAFKYMLLMKLREPRISVSPSKCTGPGILEATVTSPVNVGQAAARLEAAALSSRVTVPKQLFAN